MVGSYTRYNKIQLIDLVNKLKASNRKLIVDNWKLKNQQQNFNSKSEILYPSVMKRVGHRIQTTKNRRLLAKKRLKNKG